MRKIFPFTLLLLVLIWLSSIFIIPIFFQYPNTANEFGDMFGAVNALFSGLALSALIATLWLQKQEIKNQADTQESQAQLLKETAHVHALNALLTSYTQQIGLSPGTLSGEERTRINEIRKELERRVLETKF